MIGNRPVLRATHNILPAKDVSKENFSTAELVNKTSLPTKVFQQQQQENQFPPVTCKAVSQNVRPILTAVRSIKLSTKENDDDNRMLISPMVKTANIVQPVLFSKSESRTRQELEEDLFELPDYRQSIFDHLKSIEQLYAPKKNFLDLQSDVNSAMRTILIDWLIEVADEYKLHDETLFLCTQYIDRFLSSINITRSRLQLLGTTCMYLASKYEEMYPPALDEFSFITDNTYEPKHILRMEQIVVQSLNFSLSGPTCFTFLQYYLTCLKSSDDEYQSLQMLSLYLCTLTLLYDRPFSCYRPSIIAASCLYLAQSLLNSESIWSARYVQLTSYTEKDLERCSINLREMQEKMFNQDKRTCSLLRRYARQNKEKQSYRERVCEIIHSSKLEHVDDDEEEDVDDVLDLTLDEVNESQMSTDLQR